MLVPNHIYVTGQDKKLKLFISDNFSEANSIQFMIDELILSIKNTDKYINIELLHNNELQGLIQFEKDE